MLPIKLNYIIDPYKAFLEVNQNYSLLLDSCIRVKDTGDNSFIFFSPKFVIKYKESKIFISEGSSEKIIEEDVLSFIDRYLKSVKPLNTGLIFDGGFAGYLSYDFGMELMKVNRKNSVYYETPGVFMGYYEDFIIIDHKNNCTYIHTKNREIVNKICKLKDSINTQEALAEAEIALASNFTKEEFEKRVEAVRDYIGIGDVYQVNISQQFRGKGSLDPIKLYQVFRNANYGPYNAFLNFGDFCILSTSPEQFFKKRDCEITTRPIKGTIRKSNNKEENETLKRELLNSEKNRAELLMIIDLERNDLSKVCEPGSVKVTALYDVEEYATVNHLVSTITGSVKENMDFKSIIKALFPGGSITGAPKLRSMEVIEELENTSRGVYTGSIGYVSSNGNMDFNIAIRTVITNTDGVLYNVGGGITWDSDPFEEYEETIHKGKAIYKVLTGRDY